jgi:hypothetical protein
MSEKYAMIDNETGYIINQIMWDGVTPYTPPANTTLKLYSDLSPEELIFPPKENTDGNQDI